MAKHKKTEAARAASRLHDITAWVAAGKNNSEIARNLGVNESSIRRLRIRHNINSPKPEGAGVSRAKGPEWGYGQAQLVASAGNDWEVGVALSDLHFPYQDDAVLDAALELIAALEPDRVILNGDIGDFFGLSRFNTGFDRLDELQAEIDMANEYRAAVRTAAPDAVIDETEGNHDNRIKTYVEHNARALASLRALQPGSLFAYDELGINWHPGCGFLLRPDFLVKHGTCVSSIPGGTARAELQLNMISGISGHVHRSESASRHAYREMNWTVAGTMSRLDPDYVVGKPNWNQGCLVFEISKRTGLANVTNVPFIDGALRFGGQAFA